VIDLDGDGRAELVVSTYEISKTGALTGSGSVERKLLVFRREAEGLFGRRPASTLEERFGPDAIKGIGQQVNLEGDLLGRGRRDALLVNRDGALEAREIDGNLDMAGAAFYRFVPPRVVLDLRVRDLNGDGRSDILLGHARSLTVLVSKP